MKDKISIGIVTFIKRRDLIQNLINNIRKHSGDDVDIILMVNGENEELTDNGYREEILKFCSSVKNCYAFVFPEFKSLPKLWNNIVISSRTKYNLIMSDDVNYNSDIISQLSDIVSNEKSDFFTINYTFAHFVITKQKLHSLGYFDERLLALGEEDGDMVHRHIEIHGSRMHDVHVPSLGHIARYSDGATNSEIHIDNKPRINKLIREHKYTPNPVGIKGMWDEPMERVWSDYQQYPYEMFVLKNKHNMKKFDKIIEDYDA
jgi:hypothetical protein